MILYDKYFSMQATSPLGFNDSIRLQIENNICTEGGPDQTCFHKYVIYSGVKDTPFYRSMQATGNNCEVSRETIPAQVLSIVHVQKLCEGADRNYNGQY